MNEPYDEYLIWSNEHRAWWGHGENGYVQLVSEAGRYSRRHALLICSNAVHGSAGMLNEIPVRKDDVAELLKGAMFVPAGIA